MLAFSQCGYTHVWIYVQINLKLVTFGNIQAIEYCAPTECNSKDLQRFCCFNSNDSHHMGARWMQSC